MRTMKLVAPLLTLALASTSQAALQKVHEWGTFTSLVGSDGIPQDGMYHEDEKLPDFVHSFGTSFPIAAAPPPERWPQHPEPAPAPTPVPNEPCDMKFCPGPQFFANNVISQKMETPVLYFYSDSPTVVDINVKFPKGIITQTYPAPFLTYPTQDTLEKAENGNTSFRIETKPQNLALPFVPAGNIYGHARNVQADTIRSLTTARETEKFIFYRGVGQFEPRLSITSASGNLNLRVKDLADLPQAIYLVHVSESGNYALKRVSPRGVYASVSAADIARLKLDSQSPGAENDGGEKLVKSLVNAGLLQDEAKAMIDTWEHGYLKVPGLRLLYILPEQEVDAILPLTISPQPAELRRAFVARIEVLLDTEEDQILKEILARGRGFNVASLGRFAEPKLRRIVQVQKQRDPLNFQVAAILSELLQRAKKGEDTSGVLQ